MACSSLSLASRARLAPLMSSRLIASLALSLYKARAHSLIAPRMPKEPSHSTSQMYIIHRACPHTTIQRALCMGRMCGMERLDNDYGMPLYPQLCTTPLHDARFTCLCCAKCTSAQLLRRIADLRSWEAGWT